MKTTSKAAVALFSVTAFLVALAGCGDMAGRIGLGKYGDITSGTVNLDLGPIINNHYQEPLPPKQSYNIPQLEK